MLNIFYDLEPFFEDVFKEISVREYARLKNISPPTASKILKEYEKSRLLTKNQERIYLFFRANKENYLFQDLAKAYWKNKLSTIFEEIHEDLLFKRIILFGSIAKTENTINSDIDIYIDITKKEIDISKIEKKLKRKIQLHFKEASKNKHLLENIKNGIVIK